MNLAQLKLAFAQWSWDDTLDPVFPSLVTFAQQDLERQLRLRSMEYLMTMDTQTISNWMAGTVTSYATLTGELVVNVLSKSGAATVANWNIQTGPTPEAAAAIIGTSTTSLATGTGAKTLTTQTGLSLAAGQYVFIIQGSPLSLQAGSSSLAVPSDYLDLMFLTFIDGTNRYPIEKRQSINSLQALKVDSTIVGIPENIAVVGDSICFDRATDKAYGYEIGYYRHLPALASDASSNWWSSTAAEALLYATLKRISIVRKNEEEIVFFDSMAKQQMAALEEEDKKQRERGASQVVGSVRVR